MLVIVKFRNDGNFYVNFFLYDLPARPSLLGETTVLYLVFYSSAFRYYKYNETFPEETGLFVATELLDLGRDDYIFVLFSPENRLLGKPM